jgi:hypothetical protein
MNRVLRRLGRLPFWWVMVGGYVTLTGGAALVRIWLWS